MEHPINVTLLPGNQVIRKDIMSPLAVDPGDTVTWHFPNVDPNDTVEVEFHTFMPASGTSAITGSESSPFANALPQFTNGRIGPSTIRSMVPPGLYIYRILLNGQPLTWETPLFRAGRFVANFGGLEVPRT
jgi:hypothetical protein